MSEPLLNRLHRNIVSKQKTRTGMTQWTCQESSITHYPIGVQSEMPLPKLRNQGKPGARQLLLVKIQGILSEHPDNKNYGVRRMQAALAQRGTHVSLRTVYRTMSDD